MGSISDTCNDLRCQYSLLSCESITKKDGSGFILIRSLLPELSGYLPNLNAVVESGVVKLLSYHGKILKEENLDGGLILRQLNDGQLFFCIGIGSLNESIEESALKDLYSEPSNDGNVTYRSRRCSFFLENTPGLCTNCRQFIESRQEVQVERGDETLVSPKGWDSLSNEEVEDAYDDDDWDVTEEGTSKEECTNCFQMIQASYLDKHLEICRKKVKQTNDPIQQNLPLVCKICLQKFTRKCSYDRHINQHRDIINLEESISCPICKMDLKSRGCLSDHIHESHDSSSGCCVVCFKVMPNEVLPKHTDKCQSNCSNKDLSPEEEEDCDEGDEDWDETGFSTVEEYLKCLNNPHPSSLNRHLKSCQRRSKQDESSFKNFSMTCKICLKKFSYKGSYNRHCNLHKHRMNLDESIFCPICRIYLENRKCLNDHIHASHDSTLSCCGLCFEMMPKEDLCGHFTKRHNYSLKHLCPKCGQKFKFPFELKYHIAKHHDLGGEKFVVCDICGRGQPHNRALTQHIRVCHNKTKEFPCHLCNKVFYQNNRLQKHIHIHSVVKPFKCSMCNYSCARKDNVFIHIRRIHKMEPSSKDVIPVPIQPISGDTKSSFFYK